MVQDASGMTIFTGVDLNFHMGPCRLFLPLDCLTFLI